MTLDVAGFDRTYFVNVRAPFLLSQAFARSLAARCAPGSIVNVGSLAGRNGSVNVDYGTSKGAVDALTRSLAKAFAANGVRVNAVAPGLIDTDMARRAPAGVRRSIDACPAGRVGTPEEVAAVVAFLASGLSGYINGQSVAVCGGFA
jgi:NAD(P)-dependent dehydrogenase (short-subunit alcohol dehydrogenase family)